MPPRRAANRWTRQRHRAALAAPCLFRSTSPDRAGPRACAGMHDGRRASTYFPLQAPRAPIVDGRSTAKMVVSGVPEPHLRVILRWCRSRCRRTSATRYGPSTGSRTERDHRRAAPALLTRAGGPGVEQQAARPAALHATTARRWPVAAAPGRPQRPLAPASQRPTSCHAGPAARPHPQRPSRDLLGMTPH
jgi:hypothetical protein